MRHLEQLLFTKELSVLLRSGVPLLEALTSATDRIPSRQSRRMMQALIADVENGQSFSRSLGRFPEHFDYLYVNLVRLGELSGTLKDNLEYLAQELERSYTLRRKISGMLLYPSLVLGAAGILGGLITVFILPRLVKLFDAYGAALPRSTQILMATADFLGRYGVATIVGVTGLMVVGRLLVTRRFIRPYWHRFLLSVPVIGSVVQHIALTQLCRDMGIMLGSGLPLSEALAIEEEVARNRAMARAVQDLRKAVVAGRSLGEEMTRKEYRFLPPLLSKIVSAGEKSGKLGEAFAYLETFYGAETDRRIQRLTVILEPLLLFVIAGVVGFLALAILTPIYTLTGSVHR